MFYVVVEPSDNGWICYNVESREEVTAAVENGGWEMSQEQISKIFGQYVNYASPLTTKVSDDGKTVEFERPSDVDLNNDAVIMAKDKRNLLLSETDFYFCSDYPLDSEKKEVLARYRQALRDITKQSGWPRDIEWPEKPNV